MKDRQQRRTKNFSSDEKNKTNTGISKREEKQFRADCLPIIQSSEYNIA